jgi:hypothetical protein
MHPTYALRPTYKQVLLRSTAPVFLWWHAPVWGNARRSLDEDKVYVTLDEDEQKMFPAEYIVVEGKGSWSRKLPIFITVNAELFKASVFSRELDGKVETIKEISGRGHPRQSGNRSKARTRPVRPAGTY